MNLESAASLSPTPSPPLRAPACLSDPSVTATGNGNSETTHSWRVRKSTPCWMTRALTLSSS